jgi:hypothetical protein
MTHVTTLYERSPGNNFEIECSCGERSGVLLGRLRDAKRVQREHEASGEPLPQGLVVIDARVTSPLDLS